MKRIIVVCSGNICRSPMAAVLVRKLLDEAGVPSVVISAGTLNIQGQPASPHAVAAMDEIGIDLTGHRSQGVSVHLMRKADAIIIMSPGHEASLLSIDEGLAPRIHRLWAFAQPAGRLERIDDPVGLDLDAFQACRDELTTCLGAWVQHFVALR